MENLPGFAGGGGCGGDEGEGDNSINCPLDDDCVVPGNDADLEDPTESSTVGWCRVVPNRDSGVEVRNSRILRLYEQLLPSYGYTLTHWHPLSSFYLSMATGRGTDGCDHGVVPSRDSGVEVPNSRALGLHEHFLPSYVSTFSQLTHLDPLSSFYPSTTSSAGFNYAQFGLRVRTPSDDLQHVTDNQPPPRLLQSFDPRFPAPNLVNNCPRGNRSRFAQESIGSGIQACNNSFGFCSASELNPFEAASAAAHGDDDDDDDDKLLAQAEGGSAEQNATRPSLINPVKDGSYAEPRTVVDCDDLESLYLQETSSDESFVAAEESPMYGSSFTNELMSDSMIQQSGLSDFSSDILSHDDEVPFSIECSDNNYESNPIDGLGINSAQCISSDQPDSTIPQPSIFNNSEDDLSWITCSICYKNIWKYVYIPCGHNSCISCYKRILETSNNKFICPFCREPVENYVEALLSNLLHDSEK